MARHGDCAAPGSGLAGPRPAARPAACARESFAFFEGGDSESPTRASGRRPSRPSEWPGERLARLTGSGPADSDKPAEAAPKKLSILSLAGEGESGVQPDVTDGTTGRVAQWSALVPKVLGSNPAFSTKHAACLVMVAE